MIWVHRKPQWDLQCKPIVCVHLRTTNVTQRLFCLWRAGGKLRVLARWPR